MPGNYEVDLELGRLYIEPTASLTGDIKLLVETDVEASTRKVVISKSDMLYGALRYISDNPVGDQQDYYWPKVALTPDGDYERMRIGPAGFNCHEYFMSNPSLSGRGAAIESQRVPRLILKDGKK